MVKIIPEDEIDLNDEDIDNIFIDAINTSNFKLSIYLTKNKPSLLSDYGHIALVDCADTGNINMLNFLIKNGVDVNTHDSKALLSAVKNGNYYSVDSLLRHGANIHAQNNKAIKRSIRDRDPEILKLLLKYHKDNEEKEKLSKIADNMKPRKYDIRYVCLHGTRHYVYPYKNKYRLCDDCSPINIMSIKSYLGN